MDGTKAVSLLTELTTPKVILEYDLNGDPIVEYGYSFDEYQKAVEVLSGIVEDETGIHIEDVLDEEFVEEKDVRTNFDVCCESVETLAQIIDIAKIGWTKEQIIEWLNKPAGEPQQLL